jgi:hypothetical protein
MDDPFLVCGVEEEFGQHLSKHTEIRPLRI